MTTSAQTNLATTASATFDVTALCTFGGIELPASSRVPLLMRPFHEAIEHSKRYWQKSYDSATAPGTATYVGGIDTNYGAAGTATMSQTVRFNPAMRATPSVTLYDDAGNAGKVYRGGSNKTGSATNICSSGFFAVCSDTTSTTEFFFHYVASSRL